MRLTTTSDPGRRPNFAVPAVSDFTVACGIATAMAFIFWLDRATGSAPVEHLYYIPIVIAAIRFGLWPGVGTSAVAILLYHIGGELRAAHYTEADIIKMALFVGIGVVAARLSDDNKRFRHLAMTDDLTGLHNLRSWEQHLLSLIAESRRSTRPLSMLVVDLDRLKQLNDRHGHIAGAEAVRTVGHMIARMMPRDAVACRYGGDEFAIVLPGCGVSEAEGWGEELRNAVQKATPFIVGRSWPAGTLSISVGAACMATSVQPNNRSAAEAGEDLFHAADLAMYQAKSSGRNRTFAMPDSAVQASARSHGHD